MRILHHTFVQWAVVVIASIGFAFDIYSLPTNDSFWMLLAYCAGTGGSCLIIGSAAGVAAMGLERICFGWFLRYIAPLALLGYGSGLTVLFLTSLSGRP